MNSNLKYWLVVFLSFLIIGKSEKCSAGSFDYFIESTHSSDFMLYSKNNAKQIMFNLGYFYEIPEIISSFDHLKIGIGYIWDNKNPELFFNFLAFRFRSFYKSMLIGYSCFYKPGPCEEEYTYSEFSLGFLVFDYSRNVFFDRKINWIGVSSDFDFQERRIFHGGISPRDYKPDISPFLIISPYIGVSNIIHSDFFDNFDKALRNNNYGVEARIEGSTGILFFQELLLGINGKASSFYSNKLPLNETSFGLKIRFSRFISDIYNKKKSSELIYDIYANWNYTNFFYSKRSINTQIFNIGVALY